jgi:hypothetical protein
LEREFDAERAAGYRLDPELEEGLKLARVGHPDFRVGGRIFAMLASQDQGSGNLKPTPEQQAIFVAEFPEVFVPIAGGWGKIPFARMQNSHLLVRDATFSCLVGGLRVSRAWSTTSRR